jgi:hypothetical protein
MSQFVNRIRFYHFISGVLAAQGADPLCCVCKAYANTLLAVNENLSVLEREHREECYALPGDILALFTEARRRISAIELSGEAIGQKKAGNCKMPEGICFVKSSKAILNHL